MQQINPKIKNAVKASLLWILSVRKLLTNTLFPSAFLGDDALAQEATAVLRMLMAGLSPTFLLLTPILHSKDIAGGSEVLLRVQVGLVINGL